MTGWLAVSGWLAAAVLGALALSLHRRGGRVSQAEHELRGPLAALSLAVEGIRAGRSGPDIAAALDMQLERCRTGLEDLAAATRGGVRRRRSAPLALEGIARQAAAGWEPVAARIERRVRVDWGAGRAIVHADRGGLAQALGNLLSNALEHGAGEVSVRGERAGDAVRIEVANASRAEVGNASPPRATTRLEPSAGAIAGGRDIRDRPSGRGQGLAIAARAVEESGGKLHVEAGPGGTTAVVELPLAER